MLGKQGKIHRMIKPYTKGNGHNAYDCTFDLCQTKTKNIAKKNFLVLFLGIFYVFELKIISERGKTCTKEVETGCVKGKRIQRRKAKKLNSKNVS